MIGEGKIWGVEYRWHENRFLAILSILQEAKGRVIVENWSERPIVGHFYELGALGSVI